MRILVVEDEYKIAQAIKKGLEHNGYAVDVVEDADNALSYAVDPDYDLVILDRMLPGTMDGVEVCRKVREENVQVPILILTARGQISERVEGLQSGADDYLVKPFSFEELLARVQALLRRPKQHIGTTIKIADLEVDTSNYLVKRAGTSVALSQKEYSLLEYLLHHKNQVLTKDMIINHVWDGDTLVMPNTVEVYMGYLRQKIDRPFKNSKPLIHTLRGFGYKLSEE